MSLNIGLEAKQRGGGVGLLSELLAHEYVLYTKRRNHHWNVIGPQFNDVHKFFQEQFEALDGAIDEVGERARTLRGHAIGTLAEFGQLTRLKEHPGPVPRVPRHAHEPARKPRGDRPHVASGSRDGRRAASRHGHERLS